MKQKNVVLTLAELQVATDGAGNLILERSHVGPLKLAIQCANELAQLHDQHIVLDVHHSQPAARPFRTEDVGGNIKDLVVVLGELNIFALERELDQLFDAVYLHLRVAIAPISTKKIVKNFAGQIFEQLYHNGGKQ